MNKVFSRALGEDSIHILLDPNTGFPVDASGNPILDSYTQKPFDYIHVQYQNLDISSEQTGITANADFMFGKDLRMKVFGTYQTTNLKNYHPCSIEEIIEEMR